MSILKLDKNPKMICASKSTEKSFESNHLKEHSVSKSVNTKNQSQFRNLFLMTMMMMMTMACQHIPIMTKSHHGGNVSVMIKVGMCQCQNPTIQDKVQLGPVGSGKLFNMPPVLRHNISAQLGPSDRTQ